MVCPDCKGEGTVLWPKHVHRPGESNLVEVRCPKCEGKGKVPDDKFTIPVPPSKLK